MRRKEFGDGGSCCRWLLFCELRRFDAVTMEIGRFRRADVNYDIGISLGEAKREVQFLAKLGRSGKINRLQIKNLAFSSL